jgi:hypothetical protein
LLLECEKDDHACSGWKGVMLGHDKTLGELSPVITPIVDHMLTKHVVLLKFVRKK